MRDFTSEEQAILRRMVSYRNDNNIEALRLRNLLDEIVPNYVLIWEKKSPEHCENIDLYLPTNDKEVGLSSFYEIADFLLFIEEINELGLISVRNYDIKTYTKALFSTDKYYYENPFMSNESILTRREHKRVNRTNGYYSYRSQLQLTKLLNSYCDAVILPRPLLLDLEKNNFMTIEARRFDKQLSRTNISIIVAALAIVVPIIVNKCSSDSVKLDDIEVLTSAITKDKTVSIDCIGVMSKDTFNVKVIHPNVKLSPTSNPSKKSALKN